MDRICFFPTFLYVLSTWIHVFLDSWTREKFQGNDSQFSRSRKEETQEWKLNEAQLFAAQEFDDVTTGETEQETYMNEEALLDLVHKNISRFVYAKSARVKNQISIFLALTRKPNSIRSKSAKRIFNFSQTKRFQDTLVKTQTKTLS